MAASNRLPVPTRKQLEEDEHRVDQARGRRYCRVHREQQMIPLLPGVDVCPSCQPAAGYRSPQPDLLSDEADGTSAAVTPGKARG
ncbi:hypothetical protein LXH13_06025 [Streptomyces spinosirectus]|jgi:hypothetical protein|uniref:hypothetical protein n=1 Tax=Streptomyces TaxID=1883 RepID=UPI001C9DA42B|nr:MULTISPECIES: hypothetical protein [Streptomyces]MBY8342038.1 hypothetical protein [Streptomyces plumbidurans]UIR16617.1 hypothetical protein LXH13_06025 [Streptomyces spinosirectus]